MHCSRKFHLHATFGSTEHAKQLKEHASAAVAHGQALMCTFLSAPDVSALAAVLRTVEMTGISKGKYLKAFSKS